MITREQVADLLPGDVVELRSVGRRVHGRVDWKGPESFGVGQRVFGVGPSEWALTVASRVPRPVTTEDLAAETYELVEDLCQVANNIADDEQAELVIRIAARIRRNTHLLVNGETGQVVP